MHTITFKKNCISPQQFEQLHKNGGLFFVQVGATYLYLFALFALLYWLHWHWALANRIIIAPLMVLLIGIGQYVLAQATHEAVHQYYRKQYKLSVLTAILVSFPIGVQRHYRSLHLAHHKHAGDPQKDPDYQGYQFPASKLDFIRNCLWNLSGFAATQQFLKQINETKQSNPDNAVSTYSYDFLIMCVLQLLIGSMFVYGFGGVWGIIYYIVFWLLPVITVTKTLNQLRLLAEHGSPDGQFVLRSFENDGWIARILGVFGFRQHAEHHLFEMIPYDRLFEAGAAVQQAGKHLPASDEERKNSHGIVIEYFDGNHLQLLRQWLKSLPLYEKKIVFLP